MPRICFEGDGSPQSTRDVQLAGVFLIAALLASACGAAPSKDMFEEADLVFSVGEADHRDCTTGSAILSPEYQLTRAGIRWRDDGQQLDILLEYGRIDEYKRGTWSSVAFIDGANPVVEIKDSHPRSLHSRARIMTGMEMAGSGSAHASRWIVDELANWAEAEIANPSEVAEVRGNQVRISIPANLLGLRDPSDARVTDWSWVAFSGTVNDPTSCVEAPSETPWPLVVDVVETMPS